MTPPTKRQLDDSDTPRKRARGSTNFRDFSYVPVAPNINPSTVAGQRLAATNKILNTPPSQRVSHRQLTPPSAVAESSRTSRLRTDLVLESTVFHGCTVLVQVWTIDGQNSSALYAEILKTNGAKVVNTLTTDCTHMVFMSGHPKTVTQYLSLDLATRPKAVGPSWVQACVKANLRLREEDYFVDMGDYKPSAEDRYKRRTSYSARFVDNDDTGDWLESDVVPLELARKRLKGRKTM